MLYNRYQGRRSTLRILRGQRGWWLSFTLFAVLGVALAGCEGTPEDEQPAGAYKIGEPYQIEGRWFYPAEDARYEETGIASWYGEQFHGRKTANGETFDMNKVSAAHRTLPLPSLVEVTNLDNGRSIKVRVNDRGPFARGRIIDLSRRGAEMLDFVGAGTARVKVRILADESRQLAMQAQSLGAAGEVTQVTAAPRGAVQSESLQPPPASVRAEPAAGTPPPPPPAPANKPVKTARANTGTAVAAAPTREARQNYYVQAGAFADKRNAVKLRTILLDLAPTHIIEAQSASGVLYKVRMGPTANRDEASQLLTRITNAGLPGAQVVSD